ncbi:retrovirus-related pol polyprotein from transposon TNT 1-94 [Tanacetum coccineum]
MGAVYTWWTTGSARSSRVIGKSGKVKVINGSQVVLSGIRRDNCIYSLDGHAMAGKLNASVEEKDSLAQVWHKRMGHISMAGLICVGKSQGCFGEEKSRILSELCIKSRIVIHLPVAGTLWQNGLAECMNITLIDKVRCLLIQSGLPKIFWAEATWYLEGVKGYRLYMLDNESPKIVTSKNVVFNESVMYKDTLKNSGAGADKSIED